MKMIQEVHYQTGEVDSGTGTGWAEDDGIPEITEGDEYMTLAIKPKSSTDLLKIEVTVYCSCTSKAVLSTALFQDNITNALSVSQGVTTGNGALAKVSLTHRMIAGTENWITFRVRACGFGGTNSTFNGVSGPTRRFGGKLASYISVTEYGR